MERTNEICCRNRKLIDECLMPMNVSEFIRLFADMVHDSIYLIVVIPGTSARIIGVMT